MRTKFALGTLALAAGFFAAPVLAQSSSQGGSSPSTPGMMMGQSQPGQQAQGGGMCGCCQRMAMNHQQQGQQAPRPQ